MGSTKPGGIELSAIAVLEALNATNPKKKRPTFAFIFNKPSSDKLQKTVLLGFGAHGAKGDRKPQMLNPAVEILHLAVQDRICRRSSTILTA